MLHHATTEPRREFLGETIEQLFVELADLLKTDPNNMEATAATGAKYGLESDPEATARVAAEHGLIERLE